MHFIDVTHKYGVCIGVFLATARIPRPNQPSRRCSSPYVGDPQDQLGVILSVDEAFTAILCWRADEVVGHRSLDFIHPDDQERAVANWMEMFSRQGSSQRVRLRHAHKDASYVWLEVTNHNQLADPDDPCVPAENVDVTDEVLAEDALRANERVLRRLTEALPVGVLAVAADGTLDYGNERLATIVGSRVGEAPSGEQFATAIGPDREVLRASVSTVLEEGLDVDGNVSFQPKPDTEVHCVVNLRADQRTSEVVGAIVCVTDVTEDLRLREE
jgi:PAS domain S-box-containing protein